MYLLFPKATQLQTGTIKFGSNYIGPLVISSVVDLRLVTLTDLSGMSVHGVHSIKRLKRAYFKVSHKNATNVTDIKEAIRQLNEARKQNPESIKISPEAMFCLSDGSVPEPMDLETCLSSEDPNQTLQDTCNIDLAHYFVLIAQGPPPNKSNEKNTIYRRNTKRS